MPSCFLSYARADDEPFVERFRDRLVGDGIEVWWDHVAMESRGVRFLQEIDDAIRSCDWFVLVTGPVAVRSDYVKHEIEVTNSNCVPIVVVLRLGDRAQVPDRVYHHHQFDLRFDEAGRDYQGLVRALHRPPPRPAPAPADAPARPAHLIERRSELQSLIETILADVTDPLALSSSAPASAAAGMAGVGKTTLASLVTRDCQVRHHFTGGVVFVRFGPTASAESASLQVLRTLGSGQFTKSKAAANEEAGLLAGAGVFADLHEAARLARRLLVLDDVWTEGQLEPILGALTGTPSRILLTTRRLDLGRGSGVQHHPVGLLDASTAHRFLMRWAAGLGPLPEAPPAALIEVARRCGYLPLGLAIAGSLVGEVMTWDDLAELLAGADLHRLDLPLGPYEHPGIYAAIDVSARQLELEHEPLWSRYLDLALFDSPVPTSVVLLHWGATDAEAVRARLDLQLLIRRSLLIYSGDDMVTLHDLHRSYLLARGANPVTLARRLLGAVDSAGDHPASWIAWARQEPWVRRNLFALLDCAGAGESMAPLLRFVGSDSVGPPAWFELRREAGEHAEVLADLDRADSHTRSQIADPVGLGALVEHALIRATLRSSSSNCPVELTLAAVRSSVQTPLAAWQQAQRIPASGDRLRALAQLTPLLINAEERYTAAKDLLTEARSVDTGLRSEVIILLLEGADPVSAELVDGVLDLLAEVGLGRPEVFGSLAPYLDEHQLRRARLLAEELADERDGWARRFALAELTGAVIEDEAVRVLVELCVGLDDRETAFVLLAAVGGNRPRVAALLSEHVDTVMSQQHGPPEWLLDVWNALPAVHIEQLLASYNPIELDNGTSSDDVAATLTKTIRKYPQLTSAVLPAARRLDPTYLVIRVLGVAAAVVPDDERALLIEELTARVRTNVRRSGSDTSWMGDGLDAAFGALPSEVAAEVADVARTISHVEPRARALAPLLPRLSERNRRMVLDGELLRLDQHSTGHQVERALAALAPILDKRSIHDALLVATAPRDDGFEFQFLPDIAKELDSERRAELCRWSLAIARSGRGAYSEDWRRSLIVEQVLEHEQASAVVEVARQLVSTITEPEYRCGPLAALARVAPALCPWSDVEDALAAIKDPTRRARATAGVARLAPPQQRAALVQRCLKLLEPVPPRDHQLSVVEDLLRSGDERALTLARRLLRFDDERFEDLYEHLPLHALKELRYRDNDRLHTSLARRLAEAGHEDEALRELDQVSSTLLGNCLRRLAPLLSSSAVYVVLRRTDLPASALGPLCARLAEQGESVMPLQILRARVAGPDLLPALADLATSEHDPTSRAELVGEVLQGLAAPTELNVEVWWQVFFSLGRAIPGLLPAARTRALSHAVDLVGSRNRLQAVPALWLLAPALAAVAGTDGVWQAVESARRVLSWWPSQGHLARQRQ